ncbi:MAG: hypothetical protein HUU55_13005 [Myxococcales bacterium]|nr:hypothetical protein [Myxococcales bacterium]
MVIRQWVAINGRGVQMYCRRSMTSARVTRDLGVQEATAKLSPEKRQALLQWLSKSGPFWDDERVYGSDLHLEAQGYPVEGTAIGEAAIRSRDASPNHVYDLISFDPSEWMFSPIEVRWVKEEQDGECAVLPVQNHWKVEQVQARIATARAPHESWWDLARCARQENAQLLFANNAFEPLRGCL